MNPISRLPWQSWVDLLLVAVAVYYVLRWARDARAWRLAVALVLLRVGTLLMRQLNLLMASWMFDAATIVGVLALLIVFQPELRRALSRVPPALRRSSPGQEQAFGAVGDAAFSLASAGRGALVVIVRRQPIDELLTGGVPLGGEVSQPILEAIFRKVSPVHDGAATIEASRITQVGAVLPLTARRDLPKTFGTRHRAALGLAEHSDALVVVVSEEKRTVTLVYDQQIEPVRNADELRARLLGLTEGERDAWSPRRSIIFANLGLKTAAIGLAAVTWAATYLVPGHSARIRTIPIEFANLSQELVVARPAVRAVHAELRGTAWLLDVPSLDDVVARIDLRQAHLGRQTFALSEENFDLPAGISIDYITPASVEVRLENAEEAVGQSTAVP